MKRHWLKFYLIGCLILVLLYVLGVGSILLFMASDWGPIAKVRRLVTEPFTSALHTYRTTVGDIDDAMASVDHFYAIRGHLDYDRCPLRYPWSLSRFGSGNPIALLDGHRPRLNHVVAMGYQSGFFAGIDIAVTNHVSRDEVSPSGRKTQWFLLTPEDKLHLFDTEDEFLAACSPHRLKPFDFYLTTTLLSTASGYGAPLFDIREMQHASQKHQDTPDGSHEVSRREAAGADGSQTDNGTVGGDK